VDRRSLLLGVRRIGFQRTGTLSAARAELERTRAFRRNANWRVGIEARISHLKRGLGCGAGRQDLGRTGLFAFNLQCLTVVAAG
jgi:IS5 family transposase